MNRLTMTSCFWPFGGASLRLRAHLCRSIAPHRHPAQPTEPAIPTRTPGAGTPVTGGNGRAKYSFRRRRSSTDAGRGQKGTDLNPFETPTRNKKTRKLRRRRRRPKPLNRTPEGETTAPSEGAEMPRPAPECGLAAGSAATPAAIRTGPKSRLSGSELSAPYKPAPTSPSGTRPPTSDNDPPPSLPWQALCVRRRPAMADASPSGLRRASPRVSQRSAGDDPPPAVPSVFHSAAL